jgi:hypothetical protein
MRKEAGGNRYRIAATYPGLVAGEPVGPIAEMLSGPGLVSERPVGIVTGMRKEAGGTIAGFGRGRWDRYRMRKWAGWTYCRNAAADPGLVTGRPVGIVT